jgi:hypothetical protein
MAIFLNSKLSGVYMKKLSILLMTLLLLSSAFSQMNGRRPTQYGFEVDVKPPIYYDIYITFNQQTLDPQLNVLFSIQNDGRRKYLRKNLSRQIPKSDIRLMEGNLKQVY